MVDSLLERIERYYDAVPRAAAEVERIGPFELFVRVGDGWPYYARPSLGAHTFSAADVARVRARQRELGVPESIEWVLETSPGLREAAEAGGLAVHEHQLQVLEGPGTRIAPPPGVDVRLVTPDDDVRRIGAVAGLAFETPGTQVGQTGVEALDATLQRRGSASVEFERERLRAGQIVTAVAFVDGEPIAAGSHQPVGDISEVVGVGTLPAYRRRGIAAALTSLLVADAKRRGIDVVFLSAGDDDVARVYERVGFQHLASACIAEPMNAAPVK